MNFDDILIKKRMLHAFVRICMAVAAFAVAAIFVAHVIILVVIAMVVLAIVITEGAFLIRYVRTEFDHLSDGLVNTADIASQLQEAQKTITNYEAELENISTYIEKLMNGELSSIRMGFGQKSRHMAATFVLARTLHENIADMQVMVDAAAAGDFRRRLSAEKYVGDWQKLATSINGMLDAMASPIEQAREIMEAITAGKFGAKMAADCKGEFSKLKTSINNATSALSKYTKTIAQALENIDRKSNFMTDLPGDLASIKTAINQLSDNMKPVTTTRQGAAGASPHSKTSFDKSRSRPAHTVMPRDTANAPKKFSGAARLNGLSANKGSAPSYMQSDFGKY